MITMILLNTHIPLPGVFGVNKHDYPYSKVIGCQKVCFVVSSLTTEWVHMCRTHIRVASLNIIRSANQIFHLNPFDGLRIMARTKK